MICIGFKKPFYLLSFGALFCTSCFRQIKERGQTEGSHPGYEHENPRDTFLNGSKRYILKVFKTSKTCSFIVYKESPEGFQPILKEPDYGTNQSSLFVADANEDGYWDIVWRKKWEIYAYLFHPKRENFVEVGEFPAIDTLKKNGQVLYYKALYPLLYYTTAGHDCGWIIDQHSELFVIDSNFRKISFATLENSASKLEPEYCQAREKELIKCYVPPYKENKEGYFVGQFIDSLEIPSPVLMGADSSQLPPPVWVLDTTGMQAYWQKNYPKAIPYGQFSKVRRKQKLQYYQNGKAIANPFEK